MYSEVLSSNCCFEGMEVVSSPAQMVLRLI